MSDAWYSRYPGKALNGMKHLDPDQYTVYNRLIDALYDEGGLYAFRPTILARMNHMSTRRFNTAFFFLIEDEKFVLFDPKDMKRVEKIEDYDRRKSYYFINQQVFLYIKSRFISKKAEKYRVLIYSEPNENSDLQGARGKKKEVTEEADERAREDDILKRCLDAAGDSVSKNHLSYFTFAIINSWMKAAPPCDLELDIIPAIERLADRLAKRGRSESARSWGLFRETVLEFRDRRIQGLPAPQERKHNGKSNYSDEQQNIADKRSARRARLLEERKDVGLPD